MVPGLNNGKIVFLGDIRVGKTAIINSYQRLKLDTTPTIGANSIPCIVELNGTKITLNVWDTAGQEEFKCVLPMYAHGAIVAVLVFDLSNDSSFVNLNEWIGFISDNTGIENIVIVGNKSDLISSEDHTMAEEFCSERGYPLFITSAKTRSNIDILFNYLAKIVQATHVPCEEKTVEFTTPSPMKKGCC